ncbi:MAG: Methylase involved in ubiquinone/menaquinone biosynthesis [Candidatus Nomurabacteria bacterium GW2011_GWB1_37_5]|uniref:Methylase involved in ubiquinone/menaquinone biosynthesis n=1 Tax=Candidatus Nomurabacteria bacterium GW2011_GWB1_37_5 TaxID=1618742 RepID=A0A0G0JFY6_9BACT|nr:MAG: Methylase involved in ubiquinone/menaquinone biosynthesis [Candidatus Nomurabacteria bacterium GW2011_GWB1_37_5]
MFVDPQTILQQFNLKPTDYVADLGAGTGAYSIPAGRITREGKVYAVEVQKDLLQRIKDEAVKYHLSNIEAIWGDIENNGGTKLKDAAVDAVIASNVLFQVPNKAGFASEINRILKPGGRLLFVDWKDSGSGLGPNSSMLVSKDSAKMIFEGQGLKFDRDIEAGEHHYGIIFKK